MPSQRMTYSRATASARLVTSPVQVNMAEYAATPSSRPTATDSAARASRPSPMRDVTTPLATIIGTEMVKVASSLGRTICQRHQRQVSQRTVLQLVAEGGGAQGHDDDGQDSGDQQPAQHDVYEVVTSDSFSAGGRGEYRSQGDGQGDGQGGKQQNQSQPDRTGQLPDGKPEYLPHLAIDHVAEDAFQRLVQRLNPEESRAQLPG